MPGPPLDIASIRAFTFDCYGTLVNWERGILDALAPLARAAGVDADPQRLLESYARHESALEEGPYMPYRDVLRHAARRTLADFGVRAQESAADAFAHSLQDWPIFPDTIESLRTLARHAPLVITSNIDDDLFHATRFALHTDFAYVVTAQYCGSYKPNPRHFRVALALLGLAPGEVLHVAQSRYHDIAPARALGMRTCWINRRSGREGSGATPPPPPESTPDVECPDLATLASLVVR